METAGTCSTCVGKSNKIGVSNRRANGPLMQLNVNFNGSRRLEQCPWIVATDAQCDGQVPLLPKKFRSGPEAIPEGPVVLDVPEAARAIDAWGARRRANQWRQHGCTDRLGERPLYPDNRANRRIAGRKRPRIGRSA